VKQTVSLRNYLALKNDLEIDSSSRGEHAARASPLSHGKLKLPGGSDVIHKRPLIQEIHQESSSSNNAGKEPPPKKEK
jgi:hypothetical protein